MPIDGSKFIETKFKWILGNLDNFKKQVVREGGLEWDMFHNKHLSLRITIVLLPDDGLTTCGNVRGVRFVLHYVVFSTRANDKIIISFLYFRIHSN